MHAKRKPAERLNVICVDVDEMVRIGEERKQAQGPSQTWTSHAPRKAPPRRSGAKGHGQLAQPRRTPNTVTEEIFFEKVDPHNIVAVPPLSPADGVILEEVLRNPSPVLSAASSLSAHPGFRMDPPPLHPSQMSRRQPLVDLAKYRDRPKSKGQKTGAHANRDHEANNVSGQSFPSIVHSQLSSNIDDLRERTPGASTTENRSARPSSYNASPLGPSGSTLFCASPPASPVDDGASPSSAGQNMSRASHPAGWTTRERNRENPPQATPAVSSLSPVAARVLNSALSVIVSYQPLQRRRVVSTHSPKLEADHESREQAVETEAEPVRGTTSHEVKENRHCIFAPRSHVLPQDTIDESEIRDVSPLYAHDRNWKKPPPIKPPLHRPFIDILKEELEMQAQRELRETQTQRMMHLRPEDKSKRRPRRRELTVPGPFRRIVANADAVPATRRPKQK